LTIARVPATQKSSAARRASICLPVTHISD
jgi:hypothetical protein